MYIYTHTGCDPRTAARTQLKQRAHGISSRHRGKVSCSFPWASAKISFLRSMLHH